MERCLKFIVPGEPKSKARPRFSRRGGHVITYTRKILTIMKIKSVIVLKWLEERTT